ncbi:MAG: aldo/keto reductase [Gammaproteobacteria bacterium]|nr:aldo/keto reductase [Gammaproteobacteria bacterium]
MKLRQLGVTDIYVAPIVFGAMARHHQSDQQRVGVLRSALDHGFNAIDTAPLYGFGEAERQIALALEGIPRNKVQIFTKVGLRWHEDTHGDMLFEHVKADGHRQAVRKNSKPESICWEVEKSLSRLKTDHLDLVQIHHPDIHTPIAESIGALLELRRQGKLRHIGVSNFSVQQIKAAQTALGDVPLCNTQPEYSLIRRGIEGHVLGHCRAHKIGVLSYSPLAGGLLSHTPNSHPALAAVIKNVLQPLAASKHVSTASLALAWVFQQPGITAAITGASTPTQVAQLAQALELEVTGEELRGLSSAFARVQLIHDYERSGGPMKKFKRLVRRSLTQLKIIPRPPKV